MAATADSLGWVVGGAVLALFTWFAWRWIPRSGSIELDGSSVVLRRGRSEIRAPIEAGAALHKWRSSHAGVMGSVVVMGRLRIGGQGAFDETAQYESPPLANLDAWLSRREFEQFALALRGLGAFADQSTHRAAYRAAGKAPKVEVRVELEPSSDRGGFKAMAAWMATIVVVTIVSVGSGDSNPRLMQFVVIVLVAIGLITSIVLARRLPPGLVLCWSDGAVDLHQSKSGARIASAPREQVSAQASHTSSGRFEAPTLTLRFPGERPIIIGVRDGAFRWAVSTPKTRAPEYIVGSLEWIPLLRELRVPFPENRND